MPTPNPTAEHDASHHHQARAAIGSLVPQWLLDIPADARQALREQGGAALAGVAAALQNLPDVVRQLRDVHHEHRALDSQVSPWLALVADLESFAEPLLKTALQERFGLDVDVRRTWLLHPRRMQVDDSFLGASRDWMVEGDKAFRLACRPLLEVALQNFEAWEVEPGALDLPRTPARIFSLAPGQAAWQGVDLDIPVERFVKLCRALDLGGRYQRQIRQVFEPHPVADGSDSPATVARQQVFQRHEQTGLLVHLHLAHLRRTIGADFHAPLLELLHGRAAQLEGIALESTCLTLWNIELSGIVLFGADRTLREGPDRIVVYIPGDPDEPLREHASFLDFAAHLRDRLLRPDYLAFFQRFMPQRQRAHLLGKLHQTFHPKVWNPGGWYEQVLDPQASLPLRSGALDGPLLATLLQRKLAALRDDGRFLAVPTSDEDHKSLAEKLEFFAQSGVLALNALAFAVPLVGVVMLPFGIAQLAHEVYEGIGAWTRDEHEQAWTYLLDVLENLALFGVLGAAEPPRLPGTLRPVRLADGRTRLWNRDLAPFAHDIRLPGNLRFGPRALRRYQGKQWLVFDGRPYAVAGDADGAAWLEHPRRTDAYRPALRYQGGGVWLHELDQPRDWSGLALFKRFGIVAEGLDEEQARQLLLISGCHEAELRRTLADGQRPPALLLDCLERYRIHRQLQTEGAMPDAEHHRRLFDMLYQAPGAPASTAQTVILRDFASLPRRIVQELLTHADAAERALLEQQQRVPSRLAEEARLYLQSVRLARAYEGLYLSPLGNNDSTRLMLHGLAALPGWPEQLRLEIRGLRSNGPLLDSIGPSPAVHCRVLVKNADGYRLAEAPEGTPVDLFDAVFATLTSPQREALGLVAADGSAALRAKVQARPLSRPALRKVLHMQAVRPGLRSPMRLADGRPGYPLSGRGRLPAVAVEENTLLDKIRLLELPDVFPTDLLQQLRGIRLDDQAIDARLDSLLDEREQMLAALPLGEGGRPAGDDQPALSDRHLIELALWQHWRDNLLPELGRDRVPLRLFAVSLDHFPVKLPEFFRARVQRLELSGVRVAPAAMETDEDGLLRHKDSLLELFQRFPRVTALELDTLEGRGFYDLPRMLVGAYPRLAELRLLNLHLPIDQQLLDELCRLGELRHLDLSGNRASHLPVALTAPLHLDFLGLDRLGLEHWPEWLDNPALANIERISLRDNRLTDLPAQLRENPSRAEHSTWISLRGNLFSHQALIGIRASVWNGRRFSFDLVFPRTVENIVEGMMVERDLLSAALEQWHETSRQAGTLDADRLGARRVLGDTLFASWTAQTDGSTARSLVLEDLDPEDFPEGLPAFYYSRISRLELLRPRGDATQLDALVGRFQRLEQLSISASPLARLPAVLGQLSELSQLALIDTGLRVDQALIDQLAGLRRLTSLDLGGNRLGEISDASRLGQLSLHLLGLERMEISRWPAWLDALLPERVQWLNLNNNRLTTLPAHLLENAETSSGFTEISLEGNPLSEETLFSASLSEGASRPYSFRLELPEHLRDRGSWHGSSSAGGSSGALSESDLLSVEYWLKQDAVSNDVRRQHWRQLESGGDADDLLRLVGRLRHTADYRNGLTRPDLIERVWQVLTISAQDPELRLILNGMAEEPLRQLREHDTCPDGLRLEFNQMEILVYTGQALRAVVPAQRGAVLYRLMRRLYRLNELDRIARREAGNRDEAEVRLAYRLNLANRLDLPLAPEQMLYAGSANLRAGELERAVAGVRQGESGQGLLDYAAQRDFWLEYLREAYAVRFSAIREAFEARVLGLDELYPDDTPVQASARIQGLVDQRKADEGDLVRALTHEVGLEGEEVVVLRGA